MKFIQITFFACNLLLIAGFNQQMAFAEAVTAVDSMKLKQISASDTLHQQHDSTPETLVTSTNSTAKDIENKDSVHALIRENKKKNRQLFLENLISSRNAIFNRSDRDSTHTSPFRSTNQEIYRSDKSSPSEFLADNPLYVSTQFGLSSSLNRALHYGNTAPLSFMSTGMLPDASPTHPFAGTDQKFLTETSTFTIHPGYLTYGTPSHSLSIPEVLIFWENGVFDENILNVRFSRPFSRSLTAHFFSNYRYFKERAFSHRGNDIFSFFNSFQDSADLSYEGYYPLTDDHLTGAGCHWSDSTINVDLSVQYGEFNNEIALDKPAALNKAVHAMYHRYPLSIDYGMSLNLSGPWFTELQARFTSEPVVKLTGETSSGSAQMQPVRKDAKDTKFGVGTAIGLLLFSHDSIGVKYKLNHLRRIAFTDSEALAVQHTPSVFYSKQFLNPYSYLKIEAGTIISTLNNSSSVNLLGLIATDLNFGNKELRLFVQRDIIPYVSGFDSLTNSFSTDDYFRAGCEFNLDFSKINFLLGYQYMAGIDNKTVENAWPSRKAPYRQPQSVLILAPSLILGNGLSIETHTMLSGTKPHIKARGSLKYTIHPVNTSEFIDLKLYTEYWSDREKVLFAGRDDWNRQIFSTGIEIAAHIRSFRLFYKVDNILNRRFSYVPGYYSPGLTFRWGFNWFIQR